MKQRPLAAARTDDTAEKIAWLMEGLVRVGPFRVGLDPLLGLIPGLGDFLTTAVAIVVVQRGLALRIPKIAVARMVLNVLIDAAMGAVPFLGDLFDFVFQANSKNLRILRESLAGQRRTQGDWWFVGGVFAALAVAALLPLVLMVWLLSSFRLF